MKHNECKVGAAVRLHGYMAARVLAVYVDAHDGVLMAECIVTARRKVGPHGYRPRELVYVRASQAVPRDLILVSCGKLVWPTFNIRTTDKYHGAAEVTR